MARNQPPCDRPGWFPADFGLKDHHIFWYDGYYYLVSIVARKESRFAYGRSRDFCEWETLPQILTERTPEAWDEIAVWAPYVYEENGIFYLYYAGVTKDFTQSIMLATSENPADPNSWQTQGMVFQPDHAEMIWEAGSWADCRDPTMIKVGDLYYLYYTGLDAGGGIIGLATASSPTGPWRDWGSAVPAQPNSRLESATVAQYRSNFYLFYHDVTVAGSQMAGDGESTNSKFGRMQNGNAPGAYYRIGASPYGPWQDPVPFRPGWAHEVWLSLEGEWFTSYLTDYAVTISPLTWDTFFDPARPFIGSAVHHRLFPMILNNLAP